MGLECLKDLPRRHGNGQIHPEDGIDTNHWAERPPRRGTLDIKQHGGEVGWGRGIETLSRREGGKIEHRPLPRSSPVLSKMASYCLIIHA